MISLSFQAFLNTELVEKIIEIVFAVEIIKKVIHCNAMEFEEFHFFCGFRLFSVKSGFGYRIDALLIKLDKFDKAKKVYKILFEHASDEYEKQVSIVCSEQ